MAKKITMYAKNACFYCQKAKNYLENHGLDFEVIDISKNPEKKKEMIDATGYTGVPQIEIDGQWVVGFEPEQIEKKLKE